MYVDIWTRWLDDEADVGPRRSCQDGMRATVFGAVLGAGIAYAYAQYSLAPKYAANVQLMDRTIDAVQQRSSEVAKEFTHVARLEDMLSTAIEELANKDEMAAHRAGLLRESDDLYAKIFELRQALWSVGMSRPLFWLIMFKSARVLMTCFDRQITTFTTHSESTTSPRLRMQPLLSNRDQGLCNNAPQTRIQGTCAWVYRVSEATNGGPVVQRVP